MKRALLAVIMISLLTAKCFAGEAHVMDVRIEKNGENGWSVWATIQHDDEGWKHYADRWEILDISGTLIDTRVLLHPHSKEEFTRSLPVVAIPEGTEKVTIRAHDSVHGYGGKEITVNVPLE